MIPDARDKEAENPPFTGLVDFRAAQTILNQQGQEVNARHERIGALLVTGPVAITDILLGDDVDERCTFNLRPGAYELHSLWALANPLNEEPFFFLLTNGEVIGWWQRIPEFYGADSNHMAFAPAAEVSALRGALQTDTRVWNALSNLVLGYNEKEAKIFAEHGFSFGSPAGEAAPFLIAPMRHLRIATLYLGFSSCDQICAIQARAW